MQLWLNGAGASAALQEADDERKPDVVSPADLRERAFVIVQGSRDSFPKAARRETRRHSLIRHLITPGGLHRPGEAAMACSSGAATGEWIIYMTICET
jgi:hypothetical protein